MVVKIHFVAIDGDAITLVNRNEFFQFISFREPHQDNGLVLSDLSPLHSSRYEDQVRSYFSFFGIDTHLVFVAEKRNTMPNKRLVLSYIDQQTVEEIRNKTRCSDSASCFFMVSNLTNKRNFMPITPWIMMHRLVHSIVHNGFLTDCSPLFAGFSVFQKNDLTEILVAESAKNSKVKQFMDIIDNISELHKYEPAMKQVNGSRIPIDPRYREKHLDEILRRVVYTIINKTLDVRSARLNRLQDADFVAEMMTSFVVNKGTIKTKILDFETFSTALTEDTFDNVLPSLKVKQSLSKNTIAMQLVEDNFYVIENFANYIYETLNEDFCKLTKSLPGKNFSF